jgi:hypothetical protein
VTPPKIRRSTAGKWWSGSGSNRLWYLASGETETGESGGVGVGLGAFEAVNGGIEALEAAQHVIERAVLHFRDP